MCPSTDAEDANLGVAGIGPMWVWNPLKSSVAPTHDGFTHHGRTHDDRMHDGMTPAQNEDR
jgi:hypothetical protein